MESCDFSNTVETLMDQTGGYGALVLAVIRNAAKKHGGTLYTNPTTSLVEHIVLPHSALDVGRREVMESLNKLTRLLLACLNKPIPYVSSS